MIKRNTIFLNCDQELFQRFKEDLLRKCTGKTQTRCTGFIIHGFSLKTRSYVNISHKYLLFYIQEYCSKTNKKALLLSIFGSIWWNFIWVKLWGGLSFIASITVRPQEGNKRFKMLFCQETMPNSNPRKKCSSTVPLRLLLLTIFICILALFTTGVALDILKSKFVNF